MMEVYSNLTNQDFIPKSLNLNNPLLFYYYGANVILMTPNCQCGDQTHHPSPEANTLTPQLKDQTAIQVPSGSANGRGLLQ